MSTEEIIQQILCRAQVPLPGRRRDIEKELRTHIEDFVGIAQESGYSDEDISKLVQANFGDPEEIARDFAHVYRRERAAYRFGAFLLIAVVGAGVVSSAFLLFQAALTLSVGEPALRLTEPHHLRFEASYLIGTAAAFAGLISFERYYGEGLLNRSIAMLSACFALAAAPLVYFFGHFEIALFSLLTGLGFRMIQLVLKHTAARFGAIVFAFGLAALVSACRPGTPPFVLQFAVWVSIGLCCHLMTLIVPRMDRVLDAWSARF